MPQLWKAAVLTDTDRVFAAALVPPGGIFHGVDIDLKVHGVETVIANAVMLGVDAYAIPMEDLDSNLTYDSIWDLLVPKTSEDVDTLDLDPNVSDTDPDFEPGELDWNAVFDFGDPPERLYKLRRVFTAADYVGGLAATGAFTHYLPGMTKRISVRSGGRAKVTTVVMFALSAPVLDRTTTTMPTIWTESELLMLQLLKKTAEDAIYDLLGITSAEPGLAAAGFLNRLLAPGVVEETADQFATTTWNVTAKSTFNMSVPGELDVRTLSGE